MCSNLKIEEENPQNFTFEKLECVKKKDKAAENENGQLTKIVERWAYKIP